MTRPTIFLWRMVVFLAAVGVMAGLLSPVLVGAFLDNPVLNGLILFILLLGIGWNLRMVARLAPEVAWVEAFRRNRASLTALPPPLLLAPMASMLTARAQKQGPQGQDRVSLSATAMRSLLDGLSSRLDESRELSRYTTGLLIFLGLLGTFWGLILTIGSVGDVIGGMSIGSGDLGQLFQQLKDGLARPLNGMATAFSASLFGLAGALVLGFLDLVAGQAQNRFFNELEEWLAGQTRLSSGVLGDGAGEGSMPAYMQVLLEQSAENMEEMQRILARGEGQRQEANAAIISLSEKIGTLSEAMRANQQLMLRIGEAQQALAPALSRLGENRTDDVARGHLRNIEIYLQRALAEGESGRAQSTAELRSEIRLLTKTIERVASEPQR